MQVRTKIASAAILTVVALAIASHPPAWAQQYPNIPEYSPVVTQQNSDADYQQDPPGRVARMAVIQGEVSLEPTGSDNFAQAELNYPLTIGDRVYADIKALAELQTAGLAVRVSNGADLTLTSLTDQVAQFGLAQGSIRVSTRSMTAPDGSQAVIEIDTPNGTILVQAAGDIRVDSYPQNGSTVVTVNSGQVEVTGPNLDQVLTARESVQLTGSNPVSARFVGLLAADALDQFDQYREGEFRNTVASNEKYVSPDMIGSEDLAQYGTWSDDQEYGAVWYPTSVAVGWTPYHNGRWCYIAPWGWTWIEAEPWGFAPFHYGRWGQFGNRWGWVPGPPQRVFGRPIRPVYSPALVVFVGGRGVTAWFPLGLGEAYVPRYRTSAVYVNRINVTNIYSRDERRVRENYGKRDAIAYGEGRDFRNREQGLTALNQRDFSDGRRVERSQQMRLDANTQRQLSQTPQIPQPHGGPVAPSGFTPARVVPTNQMRPQLPTRAEYDRQRMNDGRRPDAGRPDPGRNDPGRVDPSRGDAGRGDANRGDSNRNDSNRYDQNRNDPNRNDPNRNQPGRNQPSGTAPVAPAPTGVVPGRTDSGRPDSGRTPANVDPAPIPPRPTRAPIPPAASVPPSGSAEAPPPRTYQPPAATTGTRPNQPAAPVAPVVTPPPVAPRPPEQRPVNQTPRQPDQRQFDRPIRQPDQQQMRQPDQQQPRQPDQQQQRQPDQQQQRQPDQGNRRPVDVPRQLEVAPPRQQPPQQAAPQQPRQQEAPPPAARPQAPAPPPPVLRPQPTEPRRDTRDPAPR